MLENGRYFGMLGGSRYFSNKSPKSIAKGYNDYVIPLQ